MSSFVVRPIRHEITAAVRANLIAPDYGHPVHRELAKGTGPCRECLSTFAVREEDRLLFTYNAFSGTDATPQPGPVFIHADSCETFAGRGYPAGLKSLPILAESHRADGTRSALRPVTQGIEAETLSALLDDENVRFLHLRHAEAGCFIARVERASD